MINILVIDDEKHTRLLLKAILEEAGYTVFTAENGLKAMDLMESQHVDLAIVDIMMPEMDGYAFTQTLRDNENNMPILIISAKHAPEDKRRGFLVGTDDYMTKPIDEEEMLLRIKALLRRAQIAASRQIRIGEVVLDYDAFTVTKGDKIQTLPQKEFLLLYKLLSYPGKIFTRIQLMDEVWGMESEAGWETITVHIGRLRKRFDGWEEFQIESVRGLGYRAVKGQESEKV